MIVAVVIVMLIGACVYYVIHLDKRMKNQFGEDHLSPTAISTRANQLASETNARVEPIEPSNATRVALQLAAARKEVDQNATHQPLPPEGVSVELSKRTSLFGATELRFWNALQEGLGDRYEDRFVMFPRQSLLHLVQAERDIPQTQAKELAAWEVDVVLCHAHTFAPACALLLVEDTLEANYQNNLERFTATCESIDLPVIKFIRLPEYSPLAITARILKVLGVKASESNTGVVNSSEAAGQPKSVEDEAEPSPTQEPSRITANVVPLVEPKNTKGMPESSVPENQASINHQKAAVPSCPICAGIMLNRKVKAGPHAGREIWACQKYPSCKGVLVSRS